MDAPIGNRISRFWAAFNGGTAYLPIVILDSGHLISTGDPGNFTMAFQSLVKNELTRPPRAEIEAYARQVGTRMRVYARLHNTSDITLSASPNQAALRALVYEDKHVGVTGRFMRAAPWLVSARGAVDQRRIWRSAHGSVRERRAGLPGRERAARRSPPPPAPGRLTGHRRRWE